MGTGASKNNRSTVVSSCQQPTRLSNRASNRRPSRRESEEAEYVILPGIKNERLRHTSHNTPPNTEAHRQGVLGAVPTATTSNAPAETSKAVDILDGTPAEDRTGIRMEDSSPSSISSNSSSKSVTEVLDDLRTELDQVLVGHYYAQTKPAAGLLRTAEIAVLERHNQLQPLPFDYQPVIGEKTTDGLGQSNSDWVRPVDLVRQERDIMDRKRKEREGSVGLGVGQGVNEEDRTEDLQSSLVVHDLEDDQNRGDFDVQKYQAVNIPKEEPSPEGMDIFTQSTYKNYSSVDKKEDTSATKNIKPRTIDTAETSTNQIYDPTEEELLKSIDQDFI